MSSQAHKSPVKRKQGTPLSYLLGFVFCLFIGILIFVYVVTKKSHPVFTDQQGNPTNTENTDHPSNSGSSSK